MRPLLIVLLFVALAFAGCAGSDDSAGFTTPPTDAEGRYIIELTDANKIQPAIAKVPVGATVVWRVGPNGFHDVTSKSGPESFTSDSQYPSKMRAGQEFVHTFAKAGDYEYQCMVHSGMMLGTLRVA